MTAITGATGHLGRLVIDALLDRGVPADQIVALARSTEKASDLAARGLTVRAFDYDHPETLAPALAGIDRLLLISSDAVGQRATQHQAVIDAARDAGVGLVAYTSILHADTSALDLAEEHRQTEAALAASGLEVALLRNGWYTENYTGSLGAAVAHGAVTGSAGDGHLSLATRADFAAAAAAVLTSDDPAGVYELAGDDAVTLSDLAAEASRRSGKQIVYTDLPEADYRALLDGVGLPAPAAAMVAQADTAARDGALFDDGRTLSALIGRPTTPLAEAVDAALPA